MSIELRTLICDDARAERSGKHILIGVYNDAIILSKDEWEKHEGVLTLPQLTVANFISGAPEGKSKVTYWIEDPEGELFGMKERRTNEIKVTDRTNGIFVRLLPATFRKLGTYKFHFQIRRKKFEREFDVRVGDISS